MCPSKNMKTLSPEPLPQESKAYIIIPCGHLAYFYILSTAPTQNCKCMYMQKITEHMLSLQIGENALLII
jgi:hypothetical protein